MTIDDDLEKAKDANREVRRAVREGNLDLGVDAEQKINKILKHIEKYENGLMSEVQDAKGNLDNAINKFQNLTDLSPDEKHQVEEMEKRWGRIDTYLRAVESQVQDIEESGASDNNDSDSGSFINVENLMTGRHPFAFDGMALPGWDGTLYGLNGVKEDLEHIIQNSLKPLAGELEEENNKIHEALVEVTEALEEAAELHNDILEVKYILSKAKEDEQLENKIAEKNANQKLKNDIKDAYGEIEEDTEALKKIESKEEELFNKMKEAHNIVKSHMNVDQSFIQRINRDVGEIKWFGMKSTGLIKSINNISKKSEELDRELQSLIEEFKRAKELTQQVIERKEKAKTDEDKIIEEIDEYLSELEEE